ncbi:MAG: Eco57I restriction-modification methylase domain-containing protein [Nitrososphaerales archaeon]
MSSIFDSSFWEETLTTLSYQVKAETLDVSTLKETKAVPRDFSLRRVSKLYQDEYTEIAILESETGSKLSRSVCTRTARMWRQNRLRRPLLLFTNGNESYAVIVPGKKTDGEAKILWLSDILYRTDREVLDSLRFPGSADSLRQNYDSTFFPYERVRNEFFSGYRTLFEKIEKAVHKHLKKESSSYAQRFLGRLMFVYFLQRKGWLKKDKQFINSITGYKQLNELFYESLNKEGTPGIPFLNGSLFEREEYMTSALEKDLLKEMDQLYKESRSFFNDYNFTVDETTPLELEVSIDPALIGTVFENMLPEHERGSKGTFYTPASESSFICRRALANYLGHPDKISDDKQRFLDGLSLYLEKLRESKSEKEVRDFREKLLKTIVLDPAVGSGGFLLVAMQEIIHLIEDAEATVGWKSDPEEYKKRILPNLYGFDIEGEAIEIARLRLWLSLIIDQKEPEPLPNLDMNLVSIPDSLRFPEAQITLDSTIEDLRMSFHDLKEKYLNEHDARAKKRLREQLNKIRIELAQKTGTDPFVIEAFMPMKPNIVVMNPPYVEHKSIPQPSKKYYTSHYKLDKRSDLYAYFMVRSLGLISEDGVVSVICSDKWLETSYGTSLQSRVKETLTGIYGQRKGTFRADVHTVITVLKRRKISNLKSFVCLDSYSSDVIKRHYEFNDSDLRLGKWPYLRAPLVFVEKILPLLTHKLYEFATIQRGFTTGDNDFFYLKDVSHIFSADYLANSLTFKKLGIRAKDGKDLRNENLIYVENEAGERYVLDRADVLPIVRSPRELNGFLIIPPETLCLFCIKAGNLTRRYINHGESMKIPDRPTLRNRQPWYKLADLEPSKILLLKSPLDTYYVPKAEKPLLCDQRLYVLHSKIPQTVWLYLNSTIGMLTVELFSRKGSSSERGAVLDIAVEDYEEMPVPDLASSKITCDPSLLLNRKPLKYSKEMLQSDRKALDEAVLKALGVDDAEKLLSQLHVGYVEAVEDRLMKHSVE